MILIFTNKQDTHTDEVVKSLNRKGVGVFRLNTEDLVLKYFIDVSVDSGGSWRGTIEDEVGRILQLESLRVAWLRKPDFDFLLERESDPEFQEFVCSETKAFVQLLYSLPNVTWINDPFFSNRAKVKFQQLLLATELGMKVPDTLLTNRPVAASKFFRNCKENVVTKSIYTGNVTIDGINQGIPTRLLNREEFCEHLEEVSLCVTQFQAYIPKLFELRVTVIGHTVYAVRIDSQLNDETRVDWRVNTKLNPHSVFELPANVREFCLEFLRRQHLNYGAMDFIVTPAGEYVFLENNPFGQYLWLEVETGIPLTEELCSMLIRTANTQRSHIF